MTEHRTEADAVAAIAYTAAAPDTLIEGRLIGVHELDGSYRVIDLEPYGAHPARKQGTYTADDLATFDAYLTKHDTPFTEVWANPGTGFTAVIDAHAPGVPGWQRHRVILPLRRTPGYTAWTLYDGKMVNQVEFAEFLQERLPEIIDPAPADLLEIAQHLSVKRNVDFEAGQRLTSGETTLVYKETDTAVAGRKGQLAVPDKITLQLPIYEGGDVHTFTAQLRYRLVNGTLVLGVKLLARERLEEDAFVAYALAVEDLDSVPALFRGASA